MIALVLTPSPATWTVLTIGANLIFWIFVLASFYTVVVYGVRQQRAGRLVDGVHAPLPFTISGPAGWLLIVCILELVFLQSIYYVLLVLLGTVGLLMETGRTAWDQFGLGRLGPAKLLGWSLLGFGAVLAVETPLTQIVLWLFDALRMPQPEQEVVQTFRHLESPSIIIGFMVQAVILMPMVEELFFRGFLLTFLKRYTSTWMALILSSGLFAFAHADLGAALPLWCLGLVLGLAYEHTGSLLLPIGIHGCWNLITAVNLLLEKGSS